MNRNLLLAIGLLIALSLGGGAAYIVYKKIAKYTKQDSPFEDEIQSAAKRFGVDQAVIRSIIMIESTYNPDATRNDPTVTSYGLMQLTPAVLNDYNAATRETWDIPDLYDPGVNINVGAWLLAHLTKKYDLVTAAQMYNVGEAGYLRKGKRNADYADKFNTYYPQYAA